MDNVTSELFVDSLNLIRADMAWQGYALMGVLCGSFFALACWFAWRNRYL